MKAIYENETCSIGSESFLGDAMVEVLPLPKEQRGNQVDKQFRHESGRRQKEPDGNRRCRYGS